VTPVRTAEPIVPDRFDPLLSCIIVAPAGSFISQRATVAAKAEPTPAKAEANSSTTPISAQRRRAERCPRNKAMPQVLRHGTAAGLESLLSENKYLQKRCYAKP
jgi:hypothetical protein